ncbi:MAG TPA: thioredoxin domain-containing protein, partial [Sphingomonas sp.]|nr:thioredoxin domain-containing protein [Sphingomonas sp.]
VLLFGLALPAGAAPRHRAHHATDWTEMVAATPEGGVRMGNPRAKVRLVEYLSYTCPHCALFTAEAFGPITQTYVESGKVSFELRAALRDRLDFVAAMLARCGGPKRFFPLTEAIMAAQKDWEPQAIAWDSAHPADLTKSGAAAAAIVEHSGLDAIAATQGVTAAMLSRCMNDAAARKTLEATTRDAWEVRKIGGTPGFYINGVHQDGVFTWATLEPKLQAALKG